MGRVEKVGAGCSVAPRMIPHGPALSAVSSIYSCYPTHSLTPPRHLTCLALPVQVSQLGAAVGGVPGPQQPPGTGVPAAARAHLGNPLLDALPHHRLHQPCA